MIHTYKSAPLSWQPRLCPHTGRDKKEWQPEEYTLEILEHILLNAVIKMQTCICGGYSPAALKVCSKCKELKPMNFAHPAQCFSLREEYRKCYSCCLDNQGWFCMCSVCESVNQFFTPEIPIYNIGPSTVARMIYTIPPPRHFKEVVNSDNLFDFDF